MNVLFLHEHYLPILTRFSLFCLKHDYLSELILRVRQLFMIKYSDRGDSKNRTVETGTNYKQKRDAYY